MSDGITDGNRKPSLEESIREDLRFAGDRGIYINRREAEEILSLIEECQSLLRQVVGLKRLNTEMASNVPRDTRQCTGL